MIVNHGRFASHRHGGYSSHAVWLNERRSANGWIGDSATEESINHSHLIGSLASDRDDALDQCQWRSTMSMSITSSLIDGSMVGAGVIGVLMAFVAALRGIEAPSMTNVRSDTNETGAILKRARKYKKRVPTMRNMIRLTFMVASLALMSWSSILNTQAAEQSTDQSIPELMAERTSTQGDAPTVNTAPVQGLRSTRSEARLTCITRTIPPPILTRTSSS